MDYQIALSPALGLRPEDFVAGWNETPACHEMAQARLAPSSSTQYDPTLLSGAVAVLGSVALGVATNALYDLIKGVLTKQGVRQRTEIMQLDRPDGTRLLVITLIEE